MFAFRLYAPTGVILLTPFGELRVGGSRYTSQTRNSPAFSSIIASDQRLIIGVNVNDLMEKPYIMPWLHRLSAYFTDASGVVDEWRRTNLARFFFHNALAVKINAIDCAVMIKPTPLSPQPGNGIQNFTQGQLRLNSTQRPFLFLSTVFPIPSS